MAFPQTVSPTMSVDTTDDYGVLIPSGITAGMLLLMCLNWSTSGVVPVTPTDWTLVDNRSQGGGREAAVYKKIADGTESGTTIQIDTGGVNTNFTAHVWRIEGHYGDLDALYFAVTGFNNNSPDDPPNLAPGLGALDFLWIVWTAFHEETGADTSYSAAPTNYTDLQQNAQGLGSGGNRSGSARRELNAASENPGAFTHVGALGVQAYICYTFAIRPGDNPSATAAVSVPKLTALGDALLQPDANGITLLSQLASLADGVMQPSATGNVSLIALAASAEGHLPEVSTGTPILQQLQSQGQGLNGEASGNGTLVLPQLTVLADAVQQIVANSVTLLSQLTALASGDIPIVGSVVVALLKLTTISTASMIPIGTATINLPRMTTSAVATGQPSGIAIAALLKLVALASSTNIHHSTHTPDGGIVVGYQAKEIITVVYTTLTTRKRRARVSIHSPWWPRERLAEISSAHNIDRSFVYLQSGRALCDISMNDSALTPTLLIGGNYLVIESDDMPDWAGAIVGISENKSQRVYRLTADDFLINLEGREAPQEEIYRHSISGNAVVRSLVSKANMRSHTGIELPINLEPGPTIDGGLPVGGQTVLQALEEIHSYTNYEYWLNVDANPQYIKASLNWGQQQGEDLSASYVIREGVHTGQFEYTIDMRQLEAQVTAIGDPGVELPDKSSATRIIASSPGARLGTNPVQLAPGLAARTIQDLPASARNEKVIFDVMKSERGGLSGQAARKQIQDLPRTLMVSFEANRAIDWRPLRVGNYIGLSGSNRGKSQNFVVRLLGVQPHEESQLCACLAQVRI